MDGERGGRKVGDLGRERGSGGRRRKSDGNDFVAIGIDAEGRREATLDREVVEEVNTGKGLRAAKFESRIANIIVRRVFGSAFQVPVLVELLRQGQGAFLNGGNEEMLLVCDGLKNLDDFAERRTVFGIVGSALMVQLYEGPVLLSVCFVYFHRFHFFPIQHYRYQIRWLYLLVR